MDIYKARWNNAVKIANKINELLDEGYVILDEWGKKIGMFSVKYDEIRCNIEGFSAVFL